MAGFEPRTSCVRSDHSANRATTIAHLSAIIRDRFKMAGLPFPCQETCNSLV